MQRQKHNLTDDFPGHIAKINKLKENNDDFRQLAKKYHELDHRVRGLEMRDVPASDTFFHDLKKRRVQLKDEIYQFLTH